ncbi:LysE/ArgO family amino acid transporter [Halomonas halocynthiae]|uniref:LysE/ArgO family amino acid transporter n=1 Tax=Halomonas halocynthiae TaxID=176290 RepID=UPI000427B9BD|nr:LysE family transporter [Halomonas halocynthiae]
MLESYLTGLLMSGSIIVAIGAQNAYVLGRAVRREHHWWAAGMCMSTDALLITAGMLGVGALLIAAPQVMEVLRWVGVAFLAWLAGQALYRAVTGCHGLEMSAQRSDSIASVLLTTLAVTVLNPQVYLDTLVLIPAVGAQQTNASGFLGGAVSASLLWFSLLAWGGAALSPWLSRPTVWRFIDAAIGMLMLIIAISLASGGLG